MKADLVKAASEVIPNQQILVNMISRRVRQLCLGHRPLVEFSPGLGRPRRSIATRGRGTPWRAADRFARRERYDRYPGVGSDANAVCGSTLS